MKKYIYFLILLAAMFFTGCTQMNINITDSEINQRLAEHFPLKKYFLIFELACNNPRIMLADGSEKVTLSIDAKVGLNIYNNIMPLGDGSIQLTSGLKFNPDTGGLFLDDCSVDKLDIKNIPPEYAAQIGQLAKFANSTLTAMLTQYPIYQLESKERSVETVLGKFKLQDMKIKSGRLVLTMGR